jgi:hypothetical protein
MSLLVKHPQHGIGATSGAGKLQGRIRVRFASERVFDLPFEALDVLPATEIVGKQSREARALIDAVEKQREQSKPAPKPKPSRGLPAENLPERLARRFLVGLITGRKEEQLKAFKGFCTIAKRHCGKGIVEGDLDHISATSMVLAEHVAGKKTNLRYFTRLLKQTYADNARKQGALKRGRGITFVSLDSSAGQKIAGSILGVGRDKMPGKPTAARQSPDSLNEKANRRIATEFRPKTHDPAGFEPRAIRQRDRKKKIF